MIVLFLVAYLQETDSKVLGPVSGVRWEVEGGVDAPEVYSALNYGISWVGVTFLNNVIKSKY